MLKRMATAPCGHSFYGVIIMRKILAKAVITSTLLLAITGCEQKTAAITPQPLPPELQIAFLPDVHFHDIYADFSDSSFPGPVNSISGKQATIRTMAAQLKSTRLFNENYFALLAALDDIAVRGVKLVVLPGDFSDDGQPAHVQGLRKILQHYRQQHGMTFLVTNGNHDPVRPFSRPAGKPDYLNAGGTPQPVFSPGTAACPEQAPAQLQTICTEQVQELGYQQLMDELALFGFYPQPDYLYWETPYSRYNQQDYQLVTATEQADFSLRQYEICYQGAGGPYRQKNYTHCRQVPDSSYLAEPVQGLWLLSVDANVYIPDNRQSETDTTAFQGSGNAGYNAMLTHKPHVIDWIADVRKRAEASGKTLITFSHYPMTEFYQGQAAPLAALFGKNRFQLARSPEKTTAQKMAATGIGIHIGGHMHLNNTGTVYLPDGRYLINIQAPSIAAYVPAYKLLTLSADNIESETIILNDVPRFNELFEHYRLEHQALQAAGSDILWDSAVLSAGNYREFTRWHLTELTRQRFLPADWPQALRQLLLSLNGKQMLIMSQLADTIPLQVLEHQSVDTLMRTPLWSTAETTAEALLAGSGISLNDLAQWSGFELATDFYRLRNAGQLALADISQTRLAQYQLFTRLLQPPVATEPEAHLNQSLSAFVSGHFGSLFSILNAFTHGAPNDHFMINRATGELTDLSVSQRY